MVQLVMHLKEVQVDLEYIKFVLAAKAQGQYDSKTFEVKMRPVSRVPNLRPGMSVLLDTK